MLTGSRGFPGDDLSEVLATVLKTDPNWHALPPETPPAVRRLLRRCLEKDPRKRLSSIADARLELEESDPAALCCSCPESTASIRRDPHCVVGIVVAAMAATAAAMLLAGNWKLGNWKQHAACCHFADPPDHLAATRRRSHRHEPPSAGDFAGRKPHRVCRPARRQPPPVSSQLVRRRFRPARRHRRRTHAVLLTRRPVDRLLHQHAS